MNGPDGMEEREFEREEALERDYEFFDLLEDEADTEREAIPTAESLLPVKCIVNGHIGYRYCQRCGSAL